MEEKDIVFAFDFETRSFAVKKVVNTFKNWAQTYFIIKTDIGDSIKATGRHMFWIENEKRWQIARKLNAGDCLKTHNGFASVTDVIRVDNVEIDTFNLEIQDCHNYLVGRNGILVHNKSKTSKFESDVRSDVEFYRVIDLETGKTVYIGQTTQGIDARFKQHVAEGKKKGKKKDNFKAEWGDDTKFCPKKIEDILKEGPLTPYEAHVWEKHLIEKARLEGPIENRVSPISEKKYNKFKDLEYNNPC